MLDNIKISTKDNGNGVMRVCEFSTNTHSHISIGAESTGKVLICDHDAGEIREPLDSGHVDAFIKGFTGEMDGRGLYGDLTNSERTAIRDILRAAAKPDYTNKVAKDIIKGHSFDIDYDWTDDAVFCSIYIADYFEFCCEGSYYPRSKRWDAWFTIYARDGMRGHKNIFACFSKPSVTAEDADDIVAELLRDLPDAVTIHNAQRRFLKAAIEAIYDPEFNGLDATDFVKAF